MQLTYEFNEKQLSLIAYLLSRHGCDLTEENAQKNSDKMIGWNELWELQRIFAYAANTF